MIVKETLTINGNEFIHRHSSIEKQILYNGNYYTDIIQSAPTSGTDAEYIEATDEQDSVLTDEFWDIFQKNGERTDYSYSMSNWEHFKIVPLHTLTGDNFVYLLMNSTITDASEIFIRCTAEKPSMQGLCMNCASMVKPPNVTFTSAPFVRTWTSAFAGCKSMTECEIDFGDNTLLEEAQADFPIKNRNNMQNTFFNCVLLSNITFKGKGSPKYLDLSACRLLSLESIENLLAHLYNVSSATSGDYTIKISAETMEVIEEHDEEASDKIINRFESIGWTLIGGNLN